jgi:hypothetical protein
MTDETKTRVIFRMTPIDNIYKVAECIAFFIDVPWNYNKDSVTSYMHVGQHGSSTMGFYYDCKPATPEQYNDLKWELESLGYDLDICKRWTRK